MKFSTLIMFLLCGSLFASELPDWASQAVSQVDVANAPKEAGFWTVLDRTRIEYRGGKFRRKRQVVRLILQQGSAEEAAVYTIDGEEKNTRIEALNGWHRRADGSVKKLFKKNVMTLGFSTSRYLTRETTTYAFFEQANRGDIVAFESDESESNLFTATTIMLMSNQPTAMKIIEWQSDSGSARVQPVNLESWGLSVQQSEGRLEIRNIPQIRDESLAPDDSLFFPYVNLAFLAGDSDPSASWDSLARWYTGVFQSAASSSGNLANDKAPLENVAQTIAKSMTYRQVYLEPGRGWKPLAGAEVERRAYGDCKDLSACTAYKLGKSGVMAQPALARIATNFLIDATLPASPYVFNHVIVAIPLAQSLGYAAEVVHGERRFLLYDPTDRYTPFGQLSHQWKGRNLMICDSNGALWVTVPAGAVNQASIQFGLVGALDANNSFKGKWTVSERGDAMGLLTVLNEASERDMINQLREMLSLPGLVTLTNCKSQVDATGTLSLEMDVIWPGFLQRNAGGLRLPTAIIGQSLVTLERLEERQLPLWIDELTSRSWHLELSGMNGLAALKDSWSWKETLGEFSWKATNGETFVVDYQRQRSPARYALADLKDGLKAWEDYGTNFERFLVNATVFYRN